MAPPKMLPGSSPNKAKNTIPAPAPQYADFLAKVVFMVLSSFSSCLAWYIASAVPECKWLINRNSHSGTICIPEKRGFSIVQIAKGAKGENERLKAKNRKSGSCNE
jgi:hypothetical protein